jgi:Putative peptidoglycan binding domain
MARVYRRGSKGEEVSTVQRRLHELGLYDGAIDGSFGGATEVAVRRFQREQHLGVDGTVGAETWKALFPGAAALPEPALLQRPIEFRCLALTGAFETTVPPPGCFSCVAGDFDGQGISFGALQFNLGQRTLPPILAELDRRHPALMEDIFDECIRDLRAMLAVDLVSQLTFARSIQDPNFRLHEPWRGMFLALGRTPECQAVQLEQASRYIDRARRLCAQFGVSSPRALALMFDIIVQNGSISPAVTAQIQTDIQRLDPALDPQARETERLRIVANRRAEAANPRWVEDVRIRKLCIANGGGRVHGAFYDLEEQYGLALEVHTSVAPA